MPITQYSQIRPGLAVSIVLKADQKTGREVQGTVSQLLTRHNHPRGIKVKLTDGRVGRVQQILPLPSSSEPQTQARSQTRSRQTDTNTAGTSAGTRGRMTSSNNNPWQDVPSQGNPFTVQNSSSRSQSQQGAAQSYYNNQSTDPAHQPQYPARPNQAWPQQQQQQEYGAQQPGTGQSQGGGGGDDQFFAAQGDRAAQIEHLQQYEASAPQSQADLDQAQLQKEFPNIDGSLIAAIYNERPGNLGEVRELLQELNS